MPKIDHTKKLTGSVTIKLTKADFDRLQMLADDQQLPLAEWSRDRLVEALNGSANLRFTLLAEVAATQNITISLLYAYARDGQLPEAKVREILDRARKDKFAQATELVRQAATALGTAARPALPSEDKSAKRPL
ncbi:MAG TPA: hypothetical protein VI455_15345 [Terriglobia bacterium]